MEVINDDCRVPYYHHHHHDYYICCCKSRMWDLVLWIHRHIPQIVNGFWEHFTHILFLFLLGNLLSYPFPSSICIQLDACLRTLKLMQKRCLVLSDPLSR